MFKVQLFWPKVFPKTGGQAKIPTTFRKKLQESICGNFMDMETELIFPMEVPYISSFFWAFLFLSKRSVTHPDAKESACSPFGDMRKNASNLAVEDAGIPCSTVSSLCHTVDGRNPAPVDMVNIPLFTGFHTSQVVQQFSHQQIGKLVVSQCH